MNSANLKELHRLPPLPTIKEIIKLYKLRALKQLSQNFLLDMRLTDKIVKAAGNISGGEVMEVGPGPGGITRSIFLRNPSKVILVEKDRRFLSALEMLSKVAPCPTHVYQGDVLTFNMEEMFSEHQRRGWTERAPNIHLIGNLPFSVATRLIILWLEDISQRSNAWKYGRVPMTLTFQQEVAERMVAAENAPMRCRLSVMCQNWCSVKHKFNISGKAFLPKPEVNVGVVHLEPLVAPVIDLPFKMVEKVVRCIFSSRQRKCIRGVEALLPVGCHEEIVPSLMERAKVNPDARSFQLSIQEIRRICHAYKEVIDQDPRLARYNNRDPKTWTDLADQEGEGEEEEDYSNDPFEADHR